ncbi:terpene synthase family protein [Streptomyces sp. NPDC088812]|uniref:terpene synthase family protein n=1 Tax=Streptomyces sp. NPDC088812 TaxID=3365905 RepID=UPI00380E9A07
MTSSRHALVSPSPSPSPGTPFEFPRIQKRLPLRAHPKHAQIEEECHRWARPHLVDHFGDEQLAERHVAQRMAYWACVCYPHMLDDRCFILPNIVIPAGICDDSFSGPGAHRDPERTEDLRRRWLGVLDDEPVAPDFPAGRMLYDALAPAWPQMPQTLADRYRAAFRDVVASSVVEADDRVHDGILPFDAYLELRLTDLFGRWATCQTEYALGCDLTAELATDATLAKARDLAVNHLTLVNDLFSVPAGSRLPSSPEECEAGEAMNSLGLLMRTESLTLQQAADRLAELIAWTEDAFCRACADIVHRDGPVHPDVPRYLNELGHLISGNRHYRTLVARSRGDAVGEGRGKASGTVTLGRLGTVHTPRTHLGAGAARHPDGTDHG